MIDVNIYQENIFHTKMLLKEFDLNNYLFNIKAEDLAPKERQLIEKSVSQEMYEIFYGRDI
jgi:S-adenosylmethionine decarboxylase